MALNITHGVNNKPVASAALIESISKLNLEGELFIGYPLIATPEGKYSIDATLISPSKGIILFDLVEGTNINGYQDRQDDLANKIQSKLMLHRELIKQRSLVVPIYFISFTPGINRLENDDDYFDIVDNYDKETIRKVYQFLLLKALKELNNPSYDITPEVITMYISHLIECIYGDKKVTITDLASGSGSLLINIAALIKGEKELTSVDVDSNYVRLQQNIFNLLETNVEIINQDALKPLNIKKQDIVISDVPFGYYADEENSLNYKLCSAEGYSLNSLLFIEQAANYLDENGVGMLVIPKKVLELEDNFKKYLEEDINLNAVITLPDEMFKNASQQKAIILITKKGQTRLPNQVFLAQIPSFQNKASYAKFIEEFNGWLENN